MPESLPLVHDTIRLLPTADDAPTDVPTPIEEIDVFGDDVITEFAPDRPCGTIHVKLVYGGRSTPMPSENLCSE
jgi:hypothetical protein